MVLGPQVYHKLPEIISKIESNEKVVDTDFPLEDKFEKLNLTKKEKRNSTAFILCLLLFLVEIRQTHQSRSPETNENTKSFTVYRIFG
jgi:hypothetical protein